MKTAISLPDALFEEIDACARTLRMTRSGLLAEAARAFVANHRRPDATQAWNDAIDAAGQPGADPAAQAFRRRTADLIRRGAKGRR